MLGEIRHPVSASRVVVALHWKQNHWGVDWRHGDDLRRRFFTNAALSLSLFAYDEVKNCAFLCRCRGPRRRFTNSTAYKTHTTSLPALNSFSTFIKTEKTTFAFFPLSFLLDKKWRAVKRQTYFFLLFFLNISFFASPETGKNNKKQGGFRALRMYELNA